MYRLDRPTIQSSIIQFNIQLLPNPPKHLPSKVPKPHISPIPNHTPTNLLHHLSRLPTLLQEPPSRLPHPDRLPPALLTQPTKPVPHTQRPYPQLTHLRQRPPIRL